MDWDTILENIIIEMEMGWIVIDWEARANKLVAALKGREDGIRSNQ